MSANISFDEAMNKTGFGLYSYLITSLAGICSISFSCVGFGSMFIVPTSACGLGTTVSQQGVLAAGPLIVLAMPIIPLNFSHYLPALCIYWNSWRLLMLVYSIPSLITAIFLYFMQESPKFVFVKGDEERALKILSTVYRINNWRSKEKLQVRGLLKDDTEASPPNATPKNQIVSLFKTPLLKYTIIMTTLYVTHQFRQLYQYHKSTSFKSDRLHMSLRTLRGWVNKFAEWRVKSKE